MAAGPAGVTLAIPHDGSAKIPAHPLAAQVLPSLQQYAYQVV